MTTFLTHRHVHSHYSLLGYSLLGATASIEDLVARAQDDDRSLLALTDMNALCGEETKVLATDKPVTVTGWWRGNAWGGGWLQTEGVRG